MFPYHEGLHDLVEEIQLTHMPQLVNNIKQSKLTAKVRSRDHGCRHFEMKRCVGGQRVDFQNGTTITSI